MEKKSTVLVGYIHKILKQQNFFALYQPWKEVQKHFLTQLKDQGLGYYQTKDQSNLKVFGLNLVIYDEDPKELEIFAAKLRSLQKDENFILLGIHQGGNTYSPSMLKQLPVRKENFAKSLQGPSLSGGKNLQFLEIKSAFGLSYSCRNLASLLSMRT